MQDCDLKQETKALAHESSMIKTRVGFEIKVISLNYWMFYKWAAVRWQAHLWWLCRCRVSGSCHNHSGMQTKSSIVFGHGVSSISKTKLHLNYNCFSMVRPLCHLLFFMRPGIPFMATRVLSFDPQLNGTKDKQLCWKAAVYIDLLQRSLSKLCCSDKAHDTITILIISVPLSHVTIRYMYHAYRLKNPLTPNQCRYVPVHTTLQFPHTQTTFLSSARKNNQYSRRHVMDAHTLAPQSGLQLASVVAVPLWRFALSWRATPVRTSSRCRTASSAWKPRSMQRKQTRTHWRGSWLLCDYSLVIFLSIKYNEFILISFKYIFIYIVTESQEPHSLGVS